MGTTFDSTMGYNAKTYYEAFGTRLDADVAEWLTTVEGVPEVAAVSERFRVTRTAARRVLRRVAQAPTVETVDKQRADAANARIAELEAQLAELTSLLDPDGVADEEYACPF